VTLGEADFAGIEGLDERLVLALGEGFSYGKAGEIAGCSRATVQRRMDDPEFRQRVFDARQATAEEALSRIEGLVGRAVDRLEEIVASANDIPSLKAVVVAIDRAGASLQQRSLGDRLGKLEELVSQLVAEKQGPRRVA
jgi:hypothetical protein